MFFIYFIFFYFNSLFFAPEKDYVFRDEPYASKVYIISSSFGNDPCLIYAIIKNTDPVIEGMAGDTGLMRILPIHLKNTNFDNEIFLKTMLRYDYVNLYVGNRLIKNFDTNDNRKKVEWFIFGKNGIPDKKRVDKIMDSFFYCRKELGNRKENNEYSKKDNKKDNEFRKAD